MSVASYAIPTHFWDKPGSSPEPLIRYLWMTRRCPFEQFSQQHSFSHCLITHYVLQPLNHPDGVLLGLLQYINVLHWKAQNWTQYPRYGLISTEVKNHFLQPTDYILPSMQLACFATRALPNHVQLGHTGLLLLLLLLSLLVCSQSPCWMHWCMALFPPRCRTWCLPLLNFRKFLTAH